MLFCLQSIRAVEITANLKHWICWHHWGSNSCWTISSVGGLTPLPLSHSSANEIEELETDEDTEEESEEELIKINEQDSLDSELLNDDDLDIDFISLDDEFDMEIFVS